MASTGDYIEDAGTSSTTQEPSKSLSFLYFFSLLGTIVGCVLSFSYPLHSLDIGAPYPTRHYFWNRVETSDNTYHYSDGSDYQTQVCWYGGNVLVAFMVITLVAVGLALLLYLGEVLAIVQKDYTKQQALFSAIAAILYTVSIVNWGTSCLNLTRVNNESTITGNSLNTTGFTIIVVFNAVSLVGVYLGWKRRGEALANPQTRK